MDFTVTTRTLSGGQWLSATPAASSITNGQTPQSVTVRVNQAGLAAGFYYGLVRVDSAAAANTPQIATIVLRVLAEGQDPGPAIQPSELVFTVVAGDPPPGSKNLFVYNVSGTPQTYVSSFTASNANDALSFSPGNATLELADPTRIVVQPMTNGLTPGVYDGQLALQFSDGIVRRVGVRTIVTPAAPLGSLPADRGMTARDSTGCTPTQLVPAITTLGQSFGVPAAWPVAIEAEVTDDCGNALNTGDVTASFSNGDPALNLLMVQGGTWQNTWRSGNRGGPVTLTITANDPARNLTGTREVTGGLGASSMAPVLSAALNGATFAAHSPLSPGSIVSLFGQNLGNGTAVAGSVPLGTTLADATVMMAGNSLPLFFGSNGQINALVSAGINTNTSQQIVLQRDNALSIPISVDVASASPGVFGYPAAGDPPQQGAIVNASTYAVADPAAAVAAGDVIAIFATGLGAVDQTISDGTAAPSAPLANTLGTATVTIGGQNAGVSFSGLAPGFVGLYQIDARVPSGLTPGNEVPVVVSMAGETSPPVTIAVR
jgi:adhesin/invasin